MNPSGYNDCCVFAHGCLIFYEIADKLVDLLVLRDYKDGNISDDPPEDSVTKALIAFLVIGLLLSIQRVLVYLLRIYLYRTDDNSLNESRIPTNLWFSFAKVWLEAFPQATIAAFHFGNCAPTGGATTVVHLFGVFSMSPFIMFVCFTFHYYCTHEEGHYRITTFVLAATLILSIMGIIFAGISINAFSNRCWPYNG